MKKMFWITLFWGITAVTLSANTETLLKQDMLLNTIAPKQGIWFKEGTKVVLDDSGKAVSGVLAKDALLAPVGRTDKIWFQAGSQVQFDKEGKIPSGILAKETRMRPNGYGADIILKAGAEVFFHPNGALKSAVLASGSLIPVAGSGKALEFLGGKKMTFDEKSRALSGVIAKNRKFKNAEGNVTAVYAGSLVEFNADGKLTNRPPKSIVTIAPPKAVKPVEAEASPAEEEGDEEED